jgi:hypothetical protein
MAVDAITNPKNTTQIDFPIERVELSAANINLLYNYKFASYNKILNQYTYEALESLSLGLLIDINLNKICNEKTEITVEIKSKIGILTKPHEIIATNYHLDKISESIINLSSKKLNEIEKLKNEQIITPDENNPITTNNTTWIEKNLQFAILRILSPLIGLIS